MKNLLLLLMLVVSLQALSQKKDAPSCYRSNIEVERVIGDKAYLQVKGGPEFISPKMDFEKDKKYTIYFTIINDDIGTINVIGHVFTTAQAQEELNDEGKRVRETYQVVPFNSTTYNQLKR